ncbi:unnamed protein product, partial [marine sediment metagenome]
MAQFVTPNLSVYSPMLVEAFESMNDQQRKAACLNGGLAAVQGCPGGGKTRCIINLIARLVADGHDPKRILAMTFTKNAAEVMNRRLKKFEIRECRVGTIHSVSLEIVRTEGRMGGCVVDSRNQMEGQLKRVVSDFQRRKLIPKRNVDKEMIAKFISTCKSRGAAWVYRNPFETNEILTGALHVMAGDWAPRCAPGMEPMKLVEMYVALEK